MDEIQFRATEGFPLFPRVVVNKAMPCFTPDRYPVKKTAVNSQIQMYLDIFFFSRGDIELRNRRVITTYF